MQYSYIYTVHIHMYKRCIFESKNTQNTTHNWTPHPEVIPQGSCHNSIEDMFETEILYIINNTQCYTEYALPLPSYMPKGRIYICISDKYLIKYSICNTRTYLQYIYICTKDAYSSPKMHKNTTHHWTLHSKWILRSTATPS